MPYNKHRILIFISLSCAVASIWLATHSRVSWAPIGFTLLGVAYSGQAIKLILRGR